MAVDNTAWDGDAAMSQATQADNPAAAYRAICAGRRAGDPALQSSWALPHHKTPRAPANADGVRNSESRLPQTQGLVNEAEAKRHLDAHMAEIRGEASADDLTYLAAEHEQHDEAHELEATDEVITLSVENETLHTLSVAKRRIGLRLLPYNTVAVHPKYGALMFEPGAFADVRPGDVRLRMDHQDPPTGLGESYADKPDAPYMEFQVSKTQRGDDQLTLAADGTSRGASVGYSELPNRAQTRRIDGQNVRVYPPNSVRLHEVSTTWQPTFEGAGVMFVLHRDEKGDGPVAENPVAAPVPEPLDYDRLTAAIVAAGSSSDRDEKIDKVLARFEETIELQRAQFQVPSADKPKALFKDWFGVTLKMLAGARIAPDELKQLALDDIVSSADQPGLVPDVFTPDYDDLVNRDRPFLSSTREVRPPATGNTMTLPIITGRAAAGSQAGGEKTEVTTTGPKVGTGTFNAKSIFAGADISIQMILRADRSFLDLLDAEFIEAYALDEESKAIDALLTGYTDSASVSHVPQNGGVMDPEDPQFGEAFKNSVIASRRRPTHIWMSVDAVAAFIDAKAPLTNAPLYSNLAAAFTAGGGAGGVLSGLTPVYVPALDSKNVDVIIGPSRGFVWAEDPAVRLTADVPSLAGRDIVLAGTLFPGPRYADAFTTYTVAS